MYMCIMVCRVIVHDGRSFFFQEYGYEERFSIVGVLQIEHVGKCGTLDGFCLSLLVCADSGDLVRGARCRWEGLREGECEVRLRTALQEHPPGCATFIDLARRF